jgi:predicted nucleic acid-binding protein
VGQMLEGLRLKEGAPSEAIDAVTEFLRRMEVRSPLSRMTNTASEAADRYSFLAWYRLVKHTLTH